MHPPCTHIPSCLLHSAMICEKNPGRIYHLHLHHWLSIPLLPWMQSFSQFRVNIFVVVKIPVRCKWKIVRASPGEGRRRGIRPRGNLKKNILDMWELFVFMVFVCKLADCCRGLNQQKPQRGLERCIFNIYPRSWNVCLWTCLNVRCVSKQGSKLWIFSVFCM